MKWMKYYGISSEEQTKQAEFNLGLFGLCLLRNFSFYRLAFFMILTKKSTLLTYIKFFESDHADRKKQRGSCISGV